MRRSGVLKLQQERWVEVGGLPGLELKIIPSAATAIALWPRDATLTTDQKLAICQSIFIDFKGYTEDDDTTPVKNTLQSRMELLSSSAIWSTIYAEVTDAQVKVIQGEDSAVSA